MNNHLIRMLFLGCVITMYGCSQNDIRSDLSGATSTPSPIPIFPNVAPTPPPAKVKLTVSNFGDGLVTVSGGGTSFTCDQSECTTEVPTGSELVLSAVSTINGEFDGWTYCDDAVAAECRLRMDSDRVVYSSFITQPILNPHVVYLDATQIRAIRDFREDGDTITFASGAALPPLSVGAIVVSEGIFDASNPRNDVNIVFLRRVLLVTSQTDGSTLLSVEPAFLSDVIYRGTLRFGSSSGASLKSLITGVSEMRAPMAKVDGDVSFGAISLAAGLLVGESDGNSITVESAKARFIEEPRPVFEINFDLPSIDNLSPVKAARFGLTTVFELPYSVRVTGPLTFDKALTLPGIPSIPVAPPIYLQIAPRFSVFIEADSPMLLNLSPKVDLFAGSFWNAENGWSKVGTFSARIVDLGLEFPEGTNGWGGGFDFGIGLEFRMLLFDLAGPFVSVIPSTGFEFSAPLDDIARDTCLLEYDPYFRMRLDAGASLSKFGIGATYRANLLDATFDWAAAMCYPSGQFTGRALPRRFGPGLKFSIGEMNGLPSLILNWKAPDPRFRKKIGHVSLQQPRANRGTYQEIARFRNDQTVEAYEFRPPEEELTFRGTHCYRVVGVKEGDDPNQLFENQDIGFHNPKEVCVPDRLLLGPDIEPPRFDRQFSQLGRAFYNLDDDKFVIEFGPATDDRGVLYYNITADDGWSQNFEASFKPPRFERYNVDAREMEFTVRAIDTSDNVSEPLLISGRDIHSPSPPKNFTLSRDANQPSTILLNWDSSQDDFRVDGYTLTSTLHEFSRELQASSDDRQNARLADMPNVSCFVVTALDSNGKTSKPSEENCVDSVGPPDVIPPTVPRNVAVEPERPHKMTISWQAATDNRIVFRYRIYDANDHESPLVEMRRPEELATTMSNLNQNEDYCFVVTALDFAGNESADSETICARIDTIPPVAPADLELTPLGNGVLRASWLAGWDEHRLDEYEIALLRTHDGLNLLNRKPASVLQHDFQLLAPDTEYCVAVRSVDGGGNLSNPSVQRCITVDTQPPTVPDNFVASHVEPEPLDSDSIFLNWGASSDNNGVTHYEIYEIAEGGGRRLLRTVSDVGVRLEGLSDGTYHCFDVVAVDAWMNRSEPSNVGCAYTYSATPERWKLSLLCTDDGLDLVVTEDGEDLIDLGSTALSEIDLPGLDPNINRLFDLADQRGQDVDGRGFTFLLQLGHFALDDAFRVYIDAELSDDQAAGGVRVDVIDGVGSELDVQLGPRYFANGATQRTEIYGDNESLAATDGDTGPMPPEHVEQDEEGGCKSAVRIVRQ